MTGEGKLSATSVAGSVDLLTDILLRLPAMTLIRSQCVSKQWRSLIFDPQFQRNHTLLHHHDRQVSGLYYKHHKVSLTGPATRIPSLGFLGTKTRLVTHCKGLLLCCIKDSYVLCNPTTKNYRLIPFTEEINVNDAPYDTSLVCDPSKSSAFKVVFHGETQLIVYSSDTCSWKKIAVKEAVGGRIYSQGVFFCGSLYWFGRFDHTVNRFDVDSEELAEIEKVTIVGKEEYFGECSGRLVLVLSRIYPNAAFTNGDYLLNIYEKESRDCRHWSNNYSVKLTPTLKFSSLLEQASLLCVVSNSASGGDYKLVLKVGHQVVSYSQRRNKKETLEVITCSPSIQTKHYRVPWVCSFVETLASV